MSSEIEMVYEGFVYSKKSVTILAERVEDTRQLIGHEFARMKIPMVRKEQVEHFLHIEDFWSEKLVDLMVFGSYLKPGNCPLGRMLYHEGEPPEQKELKYPVIENQKFEPIDSNAQPDFEGTATVLTFQREQMVFGWKNRDGERQVDSSLNYWKRVL